jgi:hypothetical protein
MEKEGVIAIKILEKLPPISTKDNGELYEITPEQKKKVKQLIRKECCNFDTELGECMVLGDGYGCRCPQMISDYILCRWFNHAVLPLEPFLYAGVLTDHGNKKCVVCGMQFLPRSNSTKYCPVCRRKVHRKQKTESERKRRSVVDR